MKRRNGSDQIGTLPLGTMAVSRMTKKQLVVLDRKARLWDCSTLAEAAEEILRDVLEEAAEKSDDAY